MCVTAAISERATLSLSSPLIGTYSKSPFLADVGNDQHVGAIGI